MEKDNGEERNSFSKEKMYHPNREAKKELSPLELLGGALDAAPQMHPGQSISIFSMWVHEVFLCFELRKHDFLCRSAEMIIKLLHFLCHLNATLVDRYAEGMTTLLDLSPGDDVWLRSRSTDP